MKIFQIAQKLLAVLTCVAVVLFAHAEGDPNEGAKKVEACAACHAKDGNSESSANPKLAGQGAKYLLKQLRDMQSGAREVTLMSGQLDSMTEADLADISAYFAAQSATLGAADKELVDLGREMYRNGDHERGVPACMGCHGPAGLGNEPAGYPRIAGQHAGYIADQLRKFTSGERANDGEGRVMRGVAERMNENEIKAVASYIEGLRP